MSQDNPLTAGAGDQQVAALLEDSLFHVKPEPSVRTAWSIAPSSADWPAATA